MPATSTGAAAPMTFKPLSTDQIAHHNLAVRNLAQDLRFRAQLLGTFFEMASTDPDIDLDELSPLALDRMLDAQAHQWMYEALAARIELLQICPEVAP